MTAPETLIPAADNTRTVRRFTTTEGDLIIARQQAAGVWLVTAHSADLRAQVQGFVNRNEAGFGGRQWESEIDGQQYPSLLAAMREAVSMARRQADFAAFHRANTLRAQVCITCHLPIFPAGADPEATAFCTGRGRHGESRTIAGPRQYVQVARRPA